MSYLESHTPLLSVGIWDHDSGFPVCHMPPLLSHISYALIFKDAPITHIFYSRPYLLLKKKKEKGQLITLCVIPLFEKW